jgi:hypothetical protein
MTETPEPRPAPRPDPTSGESYDEGVSRPLRTPGKKDEPPARSEEAKNQAAGSRKSPAPSGSP